MRAAAPGGAPVRRGRGSRPEPVGKEARRECRDVPAGTATRKKDFLGRRRKPPQQARLRPPSRPGRGEKPRQRMPPGLVVVRTRRCDQSRFRETYSAKSSKESPVLFSVPSTRLKKQLGIYLSRRFFWMQGAQPLSCFVGCRGQARLTQEQKPLRFSMSSSLVTAFVTTYPIGGGFLERM